MDGDRKRTVIRQSNKSPNVAIVILNWNGYEDTIECLESVLQSEYSYFQTIVCDNGSTDNSLDKIIDWVEGDFEFVKPKISPLQSKLSNAVKKPIRWRYHDLRSAQLYRSGDEEAQIIFIDIGTNLGFAGGNNVGLRYVLSRGVFDFVWLLNNDTVVEPESLSYLTERVRSDPKIGLCGSTIYYYEDPDDIQTLGGSVYNRWLGIAKYIKPTQKKPVLDDHVVTEVEKKMDMVHGASMMLSTKLLEEVGLMSEKYFLFSEEIDWATRAKGKFTLGYAAKSIVYHKRGRSTGSSSDPKARSISADYYNIRSRLIFTKSYFPWALPTVCMGLLGVAFNRLRRGQYDRVKMIINLIYSTLTNDFGLLNNINS